MSLMMRPTALPVVVALAIVAGVLLGAASWPRHAAAHDRSVPLGAEQNTDCPRPAAPGRLLWSYPTINAVESAPAFGSDGSLYLVSAQGGSVGSAIFSLDCAGGWRWSFKPAFGATGRPFISSPVLHSDGTLFVGLGHNSQGALYAVAAQDGANRSAGLVEPIAASLVVDSTDRIFAGTQLRQMFTGTLWGFDSQLWPLPGFPIRSNPIGVAPVLLSGNRVVFASQPNPRAAAAPIDGTPTPQPISPIRPTPTPASTGVTSPSTTPTDAPSMTPTITDTPGASGTPTASASATATSATTPPTAHPSATAHTTRWSVFLPLARADSAHEAAGGDADGTARSETTAMAVGPTRPRSDQPRSTPGDPSRPVTPMPGSQQALLHIITDAQAPGRAFALSGSAATSVTATGEVVIVTLAEEPPRMAAIALDSDPPRLLWEHFTSGTIAGSPVLGPLDPATGQVELVYADSSGLLVSLAVPGTPDALGLPTFNWAIRLDSPARGAPVLGEAEMVYVAVATKVHAFSRVDGGERWTFEWTGGASGDSLTGALGLAPGGALIAGTTRAIVAISTESRGLDPDARWPAQRRDYRNSGQALP